MHAFKYSRNAENEIANPVLKPGLNKQIQIHTGKLLLQGRWEKLLQIELLHPTRIRIVS